MKITGTLRYGKFIIVCLLSFFVVFFYPFVFCVQAQDQEKCVEVSSFDEFASSLNQIQSTGGTIILTQDIAVPAEASYTYNNGRYRKEVIIETKGYTINVEGYLELWPFLTIRGNDGQQELFYVYPGGELRLVSICLDAGEDGIAVVQEEGSFFLYGSEEDMGLPAFSCTGQMISSQTMTAAAYWRYNCEKLPIVRVPDGADFTADMLPHQVLSLVNRDYQEYEEEVSVIWDDTTFPTEHERTLVRGEFADGYSQYEDYVPQCLVIWESDTSPYFLNVYLESATEWYDMVYMYGESLQAGTIYIQSSDDGKIWTDIAGTDGYTPVEVEENASFSWILSYDQSDAAQERPRYYRLLQVLDDGTKLYSDALELSDDLIFTAADIEGGRGGETSPNEGEDQLPGGMPETDHVDEGLPSISPDPSPEPGSEPESDIGPDDWEQPEDEIVESDTSPYFLNVYLESATEWYDMVYMYGESLQAGTIYIQSSDDGKIWTDIAGTDGYTPVEVEENASFSWILSYDQSDPAQERPRYYRLLQVLDDGTKLYSDALELSDDLISTGTDIEEDRGDETSPNEGEGQLSGGMPETDRVDEALSSKSPDPSSEPASAIESDGSEQPKDEIGESESHGSAENTEEFSNSNDPTAPASNSLPSDTITAVQPEESEESVQEPDLEEKSKPAKTDEENLVSTDTEKIVGIVIVVCILACSIAFFVFKRKR